MKKTGKTLHGKLLLLKNLYKISKSF